jgi:hypothetical protein
MALHEKQKLHAALRGFQHFVTLDTRRAHKHPLRSAVDACAYCLKIRQPSPTRTIVSVTDIVAADRLLAADFTHFRH